MENQKNFVPPQPVWKCFDCGYELYETTDKNPIGLKSHEKGPEMCPNCSSTKVLNMHFQEMRDPPHDLTKE